MDKFNFNKVANETALVEFLIEIVLHISHLVLDRLPVIKSRLYFGNRFLLPNSFPEIFYNNPVL